MSEPNVPMLRKYVEWVEEQEALPEIDRTWVQRWWMTTAGSHAAMMLEMVPMIDFKARVTAVNHCGTAYCLAGKVAMDHDPEYANVPIVNNVHCADLALNLLGLEHDRMPSRHPIFRSENTAADIRRIAEQAAGERL